MKKAVSLLVAILLCVCAVVSVSAEVSPTAPTVVKDTIYIDAIVVPDNAGSVTPNVEKPFEYVIDSDGKVTLIASSVEGFKFSHWEFITGEFDIVEGTLSSPTLVIRPKGDNNIRAYAHFVKEDVTPTAPDSKPVPPVDDEEKSPTTGDLTPVFAIAGTVLLAGLAVVVLKKKAAN